MENNDMLTNEDYFHMTGVLYEVSRAKGRGLYATAARVYADRYRDRPHPNPYVFNPVHGNVLAYGSFSSQRPRNYAVQPNVQTDAILAAFDENPHTSSRAVAQDIGVSQSTVLRVLHKNDYRAYKVHLHQDLTNDDFGRRQEFVNWAMHQQPAFFGSVVWSDESNFSSDGIVNRHNAHYWSPVNPHWMMEKHMQGRWTINVWCGIVGEYIIGPHFFDGALDGRTYASFIRNDLPGLMENIPLELRQRMWFQQDGAPPHWFRDSKAAVREMFGHYWIGRLGPEERALAINNDGPISWPAGSPDFTPLDFLWGYVKGDVYETRPDDPEELKERIRHSIRNIPANVFLSLQDECLRRYEACHNVNGGHSEHLIDG